MLEPILDLGALPASRGGLLKRGCALFRGKGRKSHAYVTSGVELVGYGTVRNLVALHQRSNEQRARLLRSRRRLAAGTAISQGESTKSPGQLQSFSDMSDIYPRFSVELTLPGTFRRLFR
ncbi:hypothetical protein GCM10022227_45710 [Streptomyces sedi]